MMCFSSLFISSLVLPCKFLFSFFSFPESIPMSTTLQLYPSAWGFFVIVQRVRYYEGSPPSGVLKVTGSLLGPLPFLLKTLTVSMYSENGSRPGTMARVLFPGKESVLRSSKILLGSNQLRFLNQWTCEREMMANGDEGHIWTDCTQRMEGRERQRQTENVEERQFIPGIPF